MGSRWVKINGGQYGTDQIGFIMKFANEISQGLLNLVSNATEKFVKCFWYRARSTDCDKVTANKVTANQRFRHSDLVTDFITVISS